MPTGSKHIDIYNKQLVPQQGWDQYFFRYLDDKIDAATRSAFLSAGVLSDKTIGLNSSANDTFSADITNASRGVDDIGHIMDLSLAEIEEIENIAFENAVGITYYVGFRYQQIPSGIERNPRSSEPEYPYQLDTIGELGNPDSVTDNTTSIRLDVDGMLESGVDHSGRLVRVWLDNPVSPVEAVAYFDGVVEYDGVNYIEIPYTPTAGPLGQTLPTFSISTTALDYWVLVRGLSWFRNIDISIDGTYVYLGNVQGSGTGTTPTVFDISGQIATFLISLQRAYYGNSPDTPAPGRSIWAHRGAVKIRQSASSSYNQDTSNAPLVIDKQNDLCTITNGILHYYGDDPVLIGHSLALRSLNDGVGGFLQAIEPVMISGNTVTFTRLGVDLTQFSDYFNSMIWVVLENTTGSIYDGVYITFGDPASGNTFQAMTLDIAAATWAADTCQARLFFPMWGHFFDNYASSSYSDMGNTYRAIAKAGDGLVLRMIGAPTGENKWIKLGCNEESRSNEFFQILPGRVVMFGGGQRVNNPVFQQSVHGNAQFLIDKLEHNGLSMGWEPQESSREWGYDYRGSDFGKTPYTAEPGFQFAGTFRQPLTVYGGDLDRQEPFEALGFDELEISRVGFDVTKVPGYTDTDGGWGWILAEVQFDTPHVSDGVYFVKSQSGVDKLTFMKIDGGLPGFPSGQTGWVRFYGGVIIGTTYNLYAGNQAWVQTIVPPTETSGGTRLIFDGENNIASTKYRYGSIIQGYGDGRQMWGVRDGGVMFARAITTRAWKAGHELTQWDQVDTALVNTDDILSDLYRGTLTKFSEIELIESTQIVSLPTSEANCDVFQRKGGGTWTLNKHVNIFKVTPDLVGGIPAWFTPSNSAYLTAYSTMTHGKIPIILPQNATLTTVSVYVNPAIGDGTAQSFGIDIRRKPFAATAITSLRSSGMQYATSNVLHQLNVACDQNNVIDNSSYTYWIEIRSSNASPDLLYTCRIQYTILALGENLFNCF